MVVVVVTPSPVFHNDIANSCGYVRRTKRVKNMCVCVYLEFMFHTGIFIWREKKGNKKNNKKKRQEITLL